MAPVRPDPRDRPDRARQGHQAGAVRLRSSGSRKASRVWCTSRSWPQRHVEIPEQVVQVGDDVMVKVIDIDLDRRRISLSLKQANEGMSAGDGVRPGAVRHGRRVRRRGQLHLPRGLRLRRPTTGSKATTSSARSGRRAYAEAQVRFEQHRKQVVKASEADVRGGRGSELLVGDGGGGYRQQPQQRRPLHRRLARQRRAARGAAGETLRRRLTGRRLQVRATIVRCCASG